MLSNQIENVACSGNIAVRTARAVLSQARRKDSGLCRLLDKVTNGFPSTGTLHLALPFTLHFIPTGGRTGFIPVCCTLRCLALRLWNSQRISPQAAPKNGVFSSFEVRSEGSSVCFLVRETLNEVYCISKSIDQWVAILLITSIS
jgi:hypothetical protein